MRKIIYSKYFYPVYFVAYRIVQTSRVFAKLVTYHYRYTVSGDGTNNVYAILVEWPKDGSVILGAYKGTSKPHSVKMLGYDGE